MLIYLLVAFLYGEKTDTQSIAIAGIITEWKGTTDDIYIYIGTIDGYFHCINILTGDVLWAVDTEGCIFGSTETEKRTFIPSLDGYLFTYFNEFGYKRIPLPIRDLVFMSPFKTENGEIFASEKSTSIFFINESGKITQTYHSNSTVPLINEFPKQNSDCLVVVRTNYLLNVIDKSSKIIKFAEFDIFTGSSQSEAQNIITVTTMFSGSVIITVNGTFTAQFKINGVPTSVYGSFGKFEFKMNIEESPKTDDSENMFTGDSIAVFIELEGNSIAIPSKPFSPYETVATETEAERSANSVDVPAQTQDRHLPNYYPNAIPLPYDEIPFGRTYSKSECYGINNVHFPCVIVSTQSRSTTQSSTNDKVSVETTVTTTTLTLMPLFYIENYPFIASMLFLCFVILIVIKYITENIQKSLISQIILDETDSTVGYFNDVRCSILTTSSVDETVLKGLSELNVQHTVQIRTFERINNHDDSKEIRIAYQPLIPFTFDHIVFRQKQIKHSIKITFRNDKNYYNNSDNNDNNDINPSFEIDDSSQKQIQSFLMNMMNALSALFKNGYVHGSINNNCIFTDLDGEPLLGGLDKKCHFSDNLEEQEEDISSVANVLYQTIEQKYLEKVKPNNFDNSDIKNLIATFDPILYDLLEEMTCSDYQERPTAEEVLSHPFFFSTSQKMKILSRCKEFLKKKKNNNIYNIFNEKSFWISGSNWTVLIDTRLLQEAKQYYNYNGELTSDLVSFIRNKWEHPGFLSNGQKLVNEQYFNYFHKMFPNLFLYIYYFLDKYDFETS